MVDACSPNLHPDPQKGALSHVRPPNNTDAHSYHCIWRGTATVAPAKGSQPNDLLDTVKLASEDVRLGLSADPQAEYQLALEFARRRAAEIQTLPQDGQALPASVSARYQGQVE